MHLCIEIIGRASESRASTLESEIQVRERVAVHCSVLSVLQSVAVCCSAGPDYLDSTDPQAIPVAACI